MILPDTWLLRTALFFIGAGVGSFLNVVIYRVPRGESIVLPASHCPHCKRPIKPWDNIPILSYLLLRGRCAGCKSRISIQYPIVEAAMGGLLVLLQVHFGWSLQLLIYGVLAALLLALSVIDFQTSRLPNPITLTGAVTAAALTLLFRREFIVDMLLGGAAGIGALLMMGLIGTFLFKKESLGMGDVKLAGMIGLFVGPLHIIGMYIIGVFIGAMAGLGLMIARRAKLSQKIPFGPYLAAGTIVSLIWGERLWAWYARIAFP